MTRTVKSRLQGATNWGVGFVLTGHFVHGLTWRDYRNASPQSLLTRILGFAATCFGVAYIAFVIPTNVKTILFGFLMVVVSFVPPVFILQWLAVKWIERNQ